jgi:anti-sigma factor ChrR (cupin superfamily)
MEIMAGALDRLPWRDFGNGMSMARLAREGKSEMVLYRIQADADRNAFLKHEHLGGEFYLVLKGKIVDERGEYEQGELVFLDPKSVHAPRALGETVVLVIWPEGVQIVD